MYAMLWTADGIQVWHFARQNIPASLQQGAESAMPDINEFGTPLANFQGSCDFDAHFSNLQMIFDIDFCGSFAGPTWQMDGCPMTGTDQVGEDLAAC